MAGVSVDTGGGKGKRSVDSEINLIPMIDLMIVCISFLLITAVWSQMSRIDANANVPGQSTEPPRTPEDADKMLTVEMKSDDHFLLSWKSGATVHVTAEVPRNGVAVPTGSGTEVRYPDLAKEIAKQWADNGTHRNDDDRVQDQAILAVDNRTPFADVVAVIDAIYQPKRTFKGAEINAFNVTFATR
jgi:biopolymer transport protein ExbD